MRWAHVLPPRGRGMHSVPSCAREHTHAWGCTRHIQWARPGRPLELSRPCSAGVFIPPGGSGVKESKESGGPGPGSGWSSPCPLRCAPAAGLYLCLGSVLTGQRAPLAAPSERRGELVQHPTPGRVSSRYGTPPPTMRALHEHKNSGGPFGVSGFARPVRAVREPGCCGQGPPGVRGAEVTHGAVNPQGEQHDEENHGPG